MTLILIGANAVVFFLFQLPQDLGPVFFYEWAAIPCEIGNGSPITTFQYQFNDCAQQGGVAIFPDKAVYLTVLSHMFMHGDLGHLLSNMWFLWLFGNNVEDRYGRGWFVLLYLTAGLVAFFGFWFLNQGSITPVVGASGAVAGMLGSYLVLFPRARIISLVPLFFYFRFEVPATVFLGLWFVWQFYIAAQNTNVAWEAHIAGFLAGLAITWIFRSRLLGTSDSQRIFYGYP